MSRRQVSRSELPRDANVMMALRRELNRNSRQITQAFWREFEQIRSQQHHQLEEERSNRERIAALMRDANQDALQQAEALARSISSHGVNPESTSPRMQRKQAAKQAKPAAIMPMAKESKLEPTTKDSKNIIRISDSNVQKQQQLPSSSSTLTRVPHAPPSSRMALAPGRLSFGTQPKNSPNTSKLQLTHKPKKQEEAFKRH